MESHLNHEGPFDVPAHTDLDLDEIDKIICQLQAENSLYGDDMANLLGLAPHFGTSQPCSAFLLQSLQDSPPAPSLSTSLMTESPLMPEYESPADLASLGGNDPMMMLFPDQMGIPLDIPVEWPMSALEWTVDQPAACDGLGWSWEGLQNDGSSQQHHPHPASAASLSPDTNAVVDSSPLPPAASSASNTLACAHCGASFTDRTKLKIHTNKHTKPFRCTAPRCDYATAEKKSLQRHLVAKARWDEDHRLAADANGVREVKHKCHNAARGCTYATIRDDNLKRHASTCMAT